MPAKKKTALAKASTAVIAFNPALVSDLRRIILDAREQVARAVDSGLVLLYWCIGKPIPVTQRHLTSSFTPAKRKRRRALPEPLKTCLPSIEEIETELGRIGEEES